MDLHKGLTFAYKPDYMICNTSFYSDVRKTNNNGLIVTRVCVESSPSLWKFRVSENDLTTYYLSDLMNILNNLNDGYCFMIKHHEQSTRDINLIDYDELKETIKSIDDLWKMSKRLNIIGTSSFSIQNNSKMLSVGVCLRGRVSAPDNMCVPLSKFFDSKVDDISVVTDYLYAGIKTPRYNMKQTNKYGLSGSGIYLIIFKRNNVWDYIVFLSEESINVLNQALLEVSNLDNDFDYIHTVLGRTNTKDDSIPYTILSVGVLLEDIILYCNENSFSAPVISYQRTLTNLLEHGAKSI